MTGRTYAIRFDFPEQDAPAYAGDYQGALGIAPTLATARLWTDADTAARFLENGYGESMRKFGRVVAVEAGRPV